MTNLYPFLYWIIGVLKSNNFESMRVINSWLRKLDEWRRRSINRYVKLACSWWREWPGLKFPVACATHLSGQFVMHAFVQLIRFFWEMDLPVWLTSSFKINNRLNQLGNYTWNALKDVHQLTVQFATIERDKQLNAKYCISGLALNRSTEYQQTQYMQQYM